MNEYDEMLHYTTVPAKGKKKKLIEICKSIFIKNYL